MIVFIYKINLWLYLLILSQIGPLFMVSRLGKSPKLIIVDLWVEVMWNRKLIWQIFHMDMTFYTKDYIKRGSDGHQSIPSKNWLSFLEKKMDVVGRKKGVCLLIMEPLRHCRWLVVRQVDQYNDAKM